MADEKNKSRRKSNSRKISDTQTYFGVDPESSDSGNPLTSRRKSNSRKISDTQTYFGVDPESSDGGDPFTYRYFGVPTTQRDLENYRTVNGREFDRYGTSGIDYSTESMQSNPVIDNTPYKAPSISIGSDLFGIAPSPVGIGEEISGLLGTPDYYPQTAAKYSPGYDGAGSFARMVGQFLAPNQELEREELKKLLLQQQEQMKQEYLLQKSASDAMMRKMFENTKRDPLYYYNPINWIKDYYE
jgi:hypothetical protein